MSLIAALAAALSLVGASASQAAMVNGMAGVEELTPVVDAAFYYNGHQYCWYDGGWKGPGWYWCGYAWRHGFGWGGAVGWRGWARPGHHYYHRPGHPVHRPGH